MNHGFIREKGTVTLIDIIVTAGAKEGGITGVDEWRGRLVVRVVEKPVGGRANREIVGLFSKILRVPQSSVRIASGHKSTLKTLEIEMDAGEVKSALQSNGILYK